MAPAVAYDPNCPPFAGEGSAMSCAILPVLQSIKRGTSEASLALDFGIVLDNLTDPVVIMRRRVDPRSDAVVGAGTLSQASIDSPIMYQWDSADPQTPGVYLLEIDAAEGSWPTDQPMLFRITPDVGEAP